MKKINIEDLAREVSSGGIIVVQVYPTDTIKGNIKSIAKDEGLKLLEDNYGLLSEAVHTHVLSPSRLQIYNCMDPRVTERSERIPHLVGMISSRDWFNPRNLYVDSEIVGTRLDRGLLLVGLSDSHR